MAYNAKNYGYNRQMTGMPATCGMYGAPLASPMPQMMPTFPTGIPTGPSPTPLEPVGVVPAVQAVPAVPAVPAGEQAPQTLTSTMYTPGFLRTQIGRRMRVEFLIGTSGPTVDRIGTLLGVGASYILLRPIESDDILLCDIYSIKFVTILL
jgi:hypothetical protein